AMSFLVGQAKESGAREVLLSALASHFGRAPELSFETIAPKSGKIMLARIEITETAMFSYSDFNARLPEALETFDLTTRKKAGTFADRPPAAASARLVDILSYNVALATSIANEKARSELIVAPVLVELKRALRPDIGLFSGVDLVVDAAAGLTGTCDFLISAG